MRSGLLDSIPGIDHGFGDRLEPLPVFLSEEWESVRPRWKQVHGSSVAEVRSPRQECGEVDALFTRDSRSPIAVVTADCVPILLARRDGKAVAAVHAGWRGTRARVVQSLWESLSDGTGEDPNHWVACIGPSARTCCYEVSPELIEDFKAGFPELSAKEISPRERMLDLVAINLAQLRQIGIQEIDVLDQCTICTRSAGGEGLRYFSYRRDGAGRSGGRQFSAIRIR